MEDFNILFDEAVKENTSNLITVADKIVKKSEEEFKGYSEEERSRQDEEKEIKERLKTLKYKLKKCKNIKNPRLRTLNSKRAAKRKQIRPLIAECEMRLQEINKERDETL